LQYLQLRPVVVKPIKDLAPRLFLTEGLGYVGDKDIDPDTERREAKMLQRKIKSEKRGAMRELKRDREYINNLKREEFSQETSERVESMKAISAFLQQGQAEKNKEKRSKLKL
jgi:nucleolar protein 14